MKLSKISTGGDEAHMGTEPSWADGVSRSKEIGALTWYGYFCDRKQSKQFLIEYFQGVNRKDEATIVSKVSDNQFPIQLGFIARMMSKGYSPSDSFKKFFVTEFKKIVEIKEPVAVEKPVTHVVSIQARINDKASEETGEIEGIVDEFIRLGCKNFVDMNSYFKSRNLSSVVMKRICNSFIAKSKEIEDVISSNDPQIKEGYSNFSKVELRKLKEFLDSIVVAANIGAESNKPVRKKRKVKEKPANVLVSKLNYMKSFDELKLTSISPEKIIGSLQVWIYNTKTKLLGVYNADNAKGLSVKGSTLQNFNIETSIGKRLRKPSATIKDVLDAGKVKLKRILPELSTKESLLTGRINSDTLIVRVIS